MNVFVMGGSKNIGYFSALRLLDAGSTVTFLLRDPACFDEDERIRKFLSSKAFLVKGDALVRSDVQKGWEAAEKNGNGKIDLLLLTVGGAPSFSFTKGFIIKPANLVTQSFLNALSTMPKAQLDSSAQPKIVVVSAAGVTKDSHAALPFLLKLLYATMPIPHNDKRGLERLAYYLAGWSWNERDVNREVLPADWQKQEDLPGSGTLKNVMVVRPALLTDGKCVADGGGKEKRPYRVGGDDFGGWTVSRQDVAHFIVDAVTSRWEEYGNKRVTIAY
ncbi:hypothetical protein V5O48_008124 [Marasmius crinis-equi]|uniref:NAD(P)-binding domain-containing protein n=1 Tax=Marasmius crinis-equi TaxID=585013 RepID=A0ABR3FES8_9AGAR